MAGYTVALTGGVASGKSEIERRFAALGAAVVDADRIARELVEPGEAALQEIPHLIHPWAIRLERRFLSRFGMKHSQ